MRPLRRIPGAAITGFSVVLAAVPAEAQHRHQPSLLGPYVAERESSGTSWQAENAGMEGRHVERKSWQLMFHGFAFGTFTDQGGPRGGRQAFSTSMLMGAASRRSGSGTFGARAMVSLDPAMGAGGYRLLLQTGESADNRTHLIDRQHPHDLLMEMAVSYSRAVGSRGSVFAYAGWPGEPALGPPAFMHRPSSAALPMAPISHHWLDSTHISFGVLTGGATWRGLKLDASAFNGREPDARRWNLEPLRVNSFSGRLTVNPRPSLSLQASAGHLKAPERLHPTIDVNRYTVSAMWSGRSGLPMDITVAWGRNVRSQLLPNCFFSSACASGTSGFPYPPRRVLDAFLVESSLRWGRRALFARLEHVEKDELFPGLDPFHPRVFPVSSFAMGAAHELLRGGLGLRLGGAVGVSIVPFFIEPDYGRRPLSTWVFAQTRLR